MPREDDRGPYLRLGLALIAVAVFGYGLLVQGDLLGAFGLVVQLALLYLVWQLVRALDRIAAALDSEGVDE